MRYIPTKGITAYDYDLELQMGEIKDLLFGIFKESPEGQLPCQMHISKNQGEREQQ